MIECFKIKLLHFKEGADIFNLKNGRGILNLPCLTPFIKWNPTIIEADPFLFVHNDRLYLFYESKPWLSPGVIKMTHTKDLINWSKPIIVLQESFHLSFPWVFEDEGKIYMIPETSGDNCIRLYEAANEDLNKFRLKKTLLIDHQSELWKTSFCDSVLIVKNGVYYLFTTRRSMDGMNTLELYFSNKLEGEYRAHPSSPLFIDNKIGRNAGSIMEKDGELLRFSQDCTVRYGDNVNVSKITKLTPSIYEEEMIKEDIIPSNMPFYQEGGHQYNAVCFNGIWIVATDAKEYHKLTLHRIANRIYRQIKD